MSVENIKPGDVFIINANHTGAKIVKYLQTAPTVWQYIWRAIRGTQEEVLYYHAGIVLNSLETVEQQWKCEIGNFQRILNSKNSCLIFRLRPVFSLADGNDIIQIAIKDIGKPYGILHSIGKTITWLTGIKWFCRYLKEPNGEICINRVCKWIYLYCGLTFGERTYTELTTHIVTKYIKNNPDLFEIVYERN